MPEVIWIVIIDEYAAFQAKLWEALSRIVDTAADTISNLETAFQQFSQAITETTAEDGEAEAGKRKTSKGMPLVFLRASPAVLRLDLLPWYTSGFQ